MVCFSQHYRLIPISSITTTTTSTPGLVVSHRDAQTIISSWLPAQPAHRGPRGAPSVDQRPRHNRGKTQRTAVTAPESRPHDGSSPFPLISLVSFYRCLHLFLLLCLFIPRHLTVHWALQTLLLHVKGNLLSSSSPSSGLAPGRCTVGLIPAPSPSRKPRPRSLTPSAAANHRHFTPARTPRQRPAHSTIPCSPSAPCANAYSHPGPLGALFVHACAG